MKPLTLDALREAGACKEGIVWITPLLEAGGPSEADWLERPDYWEWALRRGFDVPVMPELIRREPWIAIRHAQDRLDDDLFIELARRDPWAALQYACRSLT